MTPTVTALLLGATGAAMQEVAHWYSLRHTLARARLRKLARSPAYWAITLAMIGCSGVGTWVWYVDAPRAFQTYLIMGAAFPLILKKAVGTFGKALKLGARPATTAPSIQEYFQ
ncbi:MAG TPA: hypothetical protein VNN80_03945 [Polyangiaceae bacterium]|jgi:hypothetical protein|nr:hypothetical protein [Polyangiaceae bacterium]